MIYLHEKGRDFFLVVLSVVIIEGMTRVILVAEVFGSIVAKQHVDICVDLH